MTGTRRVAIAGGIVVILVAMGLLTRHEASREVARAAGPRSASEVTTPSVWYCAEGTSIPKGRADETIVIGNAGTIPTLATVTVFPGGEVPRVSKQYRVAPGSVTRVRVADIAVAAEPGVIVELRGGRAGVEHVISRGPDRALGPCVREPERRWRFAGGTTEKGAELWLAVFNPFPDDAIVDIRAITGDGPRTPAALQGVVVPRYSRVSVPVHAGLPRVDLVALEVGARRGRVVAEQSLSLDGAVGRTGLGMTSGVDAARQWRFPTAVIGSGRSERLVVANPGLRQAKVTVRFALDATAIEPQSLIVPGATTIAVDLSRVPPDVGFSMTVLSDRPVVAENVGAAQAPQPAIARGIASDMGLAVGANEWVVIPARLDATSTDLLAITATDGRGHRVRVFTVDRAGPHLVTTSRLVRGARLLVDLAAKVTDLDRVVLVRSDGPIVVERESTRPGITRSHALRG